MKKKSKREAKTFSQTQEKEFHYGMPKEEVWMADLKKAADDAGELPKNPPRKTDMRLEVPRNGPGVKRICAWCGKIMRDGTEPGSHGICPECFRRETENIDSFPSKFIAWKMKI